MSRLRKAWKIGDKVITDYSGKETMHVIAEVSRNHPCESGMVVRLKPAVPKAGGIGAWLDANWFK